MVLIFQGGVIRKPKKKFLKRFLIGVDNEKKERERNIDLDSGLWLEMNQNHLDIS